MGAFDRNPQQSTRTTLALTTLALALVAGAGGAWFDAAGIQLSIWSADRDTLLALGGALLLLTTATTAGAFLLSKGGRADPFARFLLCAASAAGLLASGVTLLFLNVRLDRAPATPVALELTDLFTLEMQRRDMRVPFVRHYAAFTVPVGLRNFALVQLREDAADGYAVGQTVRAIRHAGLLAVPWYEFVDPIDGARNQTLATVCKDFQVLSARGVFADGSPHREQLRQHGVDFPEE